MFEGNSKVISQETTFETQENQETMSVRFLSVLSILLLSASMRQCRAWTSPQRFHSSSIRNLARAETRTTLSADATSNGIEIVDLASMNDNHEKEGQLMADSIVAWLDAEWIPQQVHIDMAESAKKSYIQCRESGQTDLMDIMMQISNDLDGDWAKYNADAFVNAWDIGNYCSDYLVRRSGNEGCECGSEIF